MTTNDVPEDVPIAQPAPRRRWLTRIALIAIIVLGAYFRLVGLFDWDEPSSRLHPDERFFTDVASVIHLPSSTAEYFNSAKNPLNPRNRGKEFYVYGMLPQTLTRLTAVLLTPNGELPPTIPLYADSPTQIPNPELSVPKLTALIPFFNADQHDMTSYWQIYKVGRAWSAFWDCCSIVLAFLIGRRLYGRRVGLLAALLYALSVLPIQLAHFFTVDATTGFFTLLTIYWGVRCAQGGSWLSFSALGLSIGGAMACRVTLATLGLVGVFAVAMRLWGQGSGVRGRICTPVHPFTHSPIHARCNADVGWGVVGVDVSVIAT